MPRKKASSVTVLPLKAVESLGPRMKRGELSIVSLLADLLSFASAAIGSTAKCVDDVCWIRSG